ANASPATVCTMCLGCHCHNIFHCASNKLWDGSNGRCKRNPGGRLLNPKGSVLCSDFQLLRGCKASPESHVPCHECS
ncbi:hypothetical protein BV22DRAFT_986342, partial [Leucogyrophana mollusca]